MKKILTYKGAVMTWECDSNGHMNVMYYINKFEHSGRNFGLEMGLTDLGRNDELGIVVVEQTIKYLKEVFEDELLFIESSLLAVGNKTFTILHEMYNTKNKELVSTMNVILVLFDKINRKALPIPTDIKENLIKTLG